MKTKRSPKVPPAADAAGVFAAVRQFGARMSAPAAPPDGVLTVRVIGEFSAGKTRFLCELLGSCIPIQLQPISSLERQTKLPLEITYGPAAELQLIERPHDSRPGVPLAPGVRHFPANLAPLGVGRSIRINNLAFLF